MKTKLGHILLLSLLVATPVAALTPLPPCDGKVESGMSIGYPMPLGHNNSGVILAQYNDTGKVSNERPAKLRGFNGVRVMDCGTGKFVTIKHAAFDETETALSATEFLRSDIRAEKRLKFNAVLRAAKAIFPGQTMQFRETAETCGCNVYFPELRPKSLTPYGGDY